MKSGNPTPDYRPAPENSKKLELNLEAGHGGVLVLHCEGKLIYQNEARRMAAVVTEALPAARRMVVDLSGVKAMDSAGLSELVMLHMWAEASGFELKFASPNKTLRYLFERTNLVSVFDIYASVADALAAMATDQAWSA